MTARNHVLSGGEATMAIARVTLRRTLRGRALWVAAILCLLPELFGLLASDGHNIAAWRNIFGISALLMALLPPILLAGTIGDEIDERTIAYLWSRPFPRWSFLAGKLLAIVPLLAMIQCTALTLPYFTALGGEGPAHLDGLAYAMLAVVMSTIAAAAATAALATMAPRFGMVLALGYTVVLDGIALGGIDAGISKLSIAWNTQQLAGARGLVFGGSATPAWDSLVWLVGITAVWLTVAAWRIRRIE